MVQNWAVANGMPGFSSVSSVIAALQTNGKTPNTGLISTSASDQALINAWSAVPENQTTFFQTYETAYANSILGGNNGVDAFTQSQAFQNIPVDQQISIVAMLDKAGNQGGVGALHQAVALLENIPDGQLSETSAGDALTGPIRRSTYRWETALRRARRGHPEEASRTFPSHRTGSRDDASLDICQSFADRRRCDSARQLEVVTHASFIRITYVFRTRS